MGSRLIRNLSLVQRLAMQGQELVGGGVGGLELEYGGGGDEVKHHHGSTKSERATSSSSSGLHTPPRLRASMTIDSIASNSNAMAQEYQGGRSSSSSSIGGGGGGGDDGVISASSPIGLLAVLCEQRRDEEISRSNHTTSPRGNILGIIL